MEMIRYLWIVLVFTNVAFAEYNFYTQGRYGKREESHPCSRYGRSGSNTETASKEEIKTVEISPRADRFFLGSRYGKRLHSGYMESTDGSRLASLRRLEAALNYLDRIRASHQQESTKNYEIHEIPSDKGYEEGYNENEIQPNNPGTRYQSLDNSNC